MGNPSDTEGLKLTLPVCLKSDRVVSHWWLSSASTNSSQTFPTLQSFWNIIFNGRMTGAINPSIYLLSSCRRETRLDRGCNHIFVHHDLARFSNILARTSFWPNEFNTKNVNVDVPRSPQAQGKKAGFVPHDDVTLRSWNSCWIDLRTFSAVIFHFPSLDRSKKGSWVRRSSVRKLKLSAAYSLPATENSNSKLFLERSIAQYRD